MFVKHSVFQCTTLYNCWTLLCLSVYPQLLQLFFHHFQADPYGIRRSALRGRASKRIKVMARPKHVTKKHDPTWVITRSRPICTADRYGSHWVFSFKERATPEAHCAANSVSLSIGKYQHRTRGSIRKRSRPKPRNASRTWRSLQRGREIASFSCRQEEALRKRELTNCSFLSPSLSLPDQIAVGEHEVPR